MTGNKYSATSPLEHVFHNPISSAKINKLLDLLQLESENTVFDIGAGNCEIPIRLIEKYGVSATAVEIHRPDIAEAKRRIDGRIPLNKLDIIEQDVNDVIQNYPDNHFDAGLCIGSTHAIGNFKTTLGALSNCVKPGGFILTADCYWKKTPDPAYLTALGADESDYNSHAGNIQTGVEAGLTPLWAFAASDDEWDQFEWSNIMSIENKYRDNSQDPECQSKLEKIRKWRQTYATWGRDTLGFGIYLFRN